MTLKLYGAIAGPDLLPVTTSKLTNIANPIVLSQTRPQPIAGADSYLEIGTLDILLQFPDAEPIAYWGDLPQAFGYNCDYLFRRDRIEELNAADTREFSALSKSEKSILLEYLVDETNLATEFSEQERDRAAANYYDQAEKAREARNKFVTMKILRTYGITSSNEILQALSVRNEIETYVKYYLDAATSGLINFFQSTGNYVGAGFLEIPSVAARADLDNPALKDDYVSILVNGVHSDGELY